MNWNSPRADDVVAAAFGLKLDSIFAVASRYSKLVPVVEAACRIEPAIFARVGSTPAAAVAFVVSTGMSLVPRSSPNDARPFEAPAIGAYTRAETAAIMVNEALRNRPRPPVTAGLRSSGRPGRSLPPS